MQAKIRLVTANFARRVCFAPAMRRNKSVACHCMLPTLGSTAIALLLAAVVMVDIPEQLRYATLPKESQVALIEHFATTTVSKLG